MSNVQDQLLKAISKGNVEEVENIILKRVEVDIKVLGPFILCLAISYNQSQVVKSLIKLGVNINGVCTLSKTPLHVATLIGSEEIVRLLIQGGVNMNSRDGQGYTTLHQSIILSEGPTCRNGFESDGIKKRRRYFLPPRGLLSFVEEL